MPFDPFTIRNRLMLRARLAVLVLTAALPLGAGCSSFWCRHRSPEIIDLGVTSVSEGPLLEGCAPGMPPAAAMPPVPMTPQPQATIPQLTTPPRLVPQPQSQPMPYTP
jgi:hypothetical protein